MSVQPTQQKFGRPTDNDIEKKFMNKIRGDKLQAINAECELDIELVLRDKEGVRRDVKTIRNKVGLQDNQTVIENQLAMLRIGHLNSSSQMDLLEKFKTIKDNWKFEEIEDGQELPEYFFDDGCDLSYVLHELSYERGSTKFKAEELLFLEFMCLWGRGLLNQTTKAYYEKYMDYLIKCMQRGLQKIDEKLSLLQLSSGKSKSQAKDSKKESDDNPMNKEFFSPVINESWRKDEQIKVSAERSPVSRTKIIKKEVKNLKEKSKKKQESFPQSEAEKKPEYLAIKTCNHICWAYWYIIDKSVI